jgi:broad specificity phosphatase PhoE
MHKIIYLIRHGQASAGTADYDRLSTLGERQASITGHYLRSLSKPPVAIWSGSLRRQQQSAANAHPDHAPADIHAGLDEYDHKQVHHVFHPDNEDMQPLQSVNVTDIDVPVTM